MITYLLIDFYGYSLVLISLNNLVKVEFLHHFALLLFILRLFVQLNIEEFSMINVVVLVLLKGRHILMTLLLFCISTLDYANVTQGIQWDWSQSICVTLARHGRALGCWVQTVRICLIFVIDFFQKVGHVLLILVSLLREQVSLGNRFDSAVERLISLTNVFVNFFDSDR